MFLAFDGGSTLTDPSTNERKYCNFVNSTIFHPCCLQGRRQVGAWGYILKFLSAAFYYNIVRCVSLQCCFTIVVVSLSGLFHYRSCFTIRVISLVVVSLLWLFHFSSHHHGSTFY